MKKLLFIIILILAIVSTSTFVLAQGITGDTAGITTVNVANIKKSSTVDNEKFTDVSKHWAKESINRIVEKEIFAENDGKFYPDKPITRSEFVLIMHKALKLQIAYLKEPDIREFFDDVKNEEVYASALYDLVTTGIIDYTGQFMPENTMTREEMVHFLMNAYKYKMGDNYKKIKILFKPFADDNEISPIYKGDVGRAEYEELIVRPVNNKFYPKDLLQEHRR